MRPSHPTALPEVGWVLELLRQTSGSRILSGQQERIDWFGLDNEVNFDFVRRTTGLTPAVRGFDFMFYTHSAGGRQGQRAAERAIVWAERGGVVQFCVHWFVDTGSPVGNPKFYTNETTFDLRQALIAGTPENTELLREMDLMAEELKKLRDARVPVIWRPFHECSGGWFWWGAKGAEPFKQVYRLMFDRYTRLHGLTNLIWCYNPTETPGALEAWYPAKTWST
jgi:mannan endo-1,4-beta-mannosidase